VAVATVDIQVNSQGAVSSIRNVNAAASQLESQINNTNRSVKQLETAFAGLGVAVAGMNALNIAKDFFATANAADTVQRRIKLVSAGLDDYRLVSETARNAAKKFNLSQTEAATAISDIYTRLRPVGYGLSSINAIYEGFNTSVKLSGVSASAASIAFMQLSQGLGSGTLQGDELRSILEQMPSIAQAIAKEMNISVGSIKQFGSEGKITADVIVRALDRIRTDGTDKLAVAMDTPQQKIVALGNAMEDFKVAVMSDVAPVVIGAIGQITVAIQSATQFVADLKTGFGLLASAFSGIGAGISSINTALSGTIGKFAALGQSKGLMMLLNFLTLGGAGALSQLAAAGAKKNASKPFAAPIGPEMPVRLEMQGMDFGAAGKKGKGKGKSAEERAADKAARDAARLAEQTKTQLDAAYKLNALAAADLDIQVSMTKEETLQGQFDKAALERKFKYADLQKNLKSEQERQLIISAQESEVLIANNKYAKDKKDLLEQQTKELYSQLDVSGVLDKTLQNRLSGAFMGKSATTGFRTDINLDPSKKAGKIQEYVDKAKTDLADVQGMVVSLATTVESSIGSAMSNAISGVIQGTTTVREAFSSMFKSIGDAFIQMATQMIAKAMIMKVLGILGSAASSGSKTTDFSSAFGKGGTTTNFVDALKLPALMADGGYVNGPTNAIIGEGGQPEYVIPASKMMQAMSNYSAGKRGASILGDSTSMGDGSMGGSTGAFTLETVVINNVEYATVDQVRAMSNAAAKQGAEGGFSRSMSSLRNSRSQRSRLGMR
jgi:tape measure domain-containing protein